MSLLLKMKNNKVLKDSILLEDAYVDFISTGCAPLNLLFSGKLDGGIPTGKMSQIAAPASLGKTFLGFKIAANAQKKNFEILYLDTEFAFDFKFAQSVGIDTNKILVIQDNHIESVQSKILTLLDELNAEEKKSLLIVVDSWGGLVTSKTVDDATSGADKTDMTIAKKKNSFARLLTGSGCTIFVINQVFDTFNQFDPIAPGGGRGLAFASSSIVMSTSKAQDKDADEIIGAVIIAKTVKSRFAKERSKLKYTIKYEGGIHPVIGLEDDLLEMGYMTKPAMGWYSRNFQLLGLEGEDKKWRMKEIQENWKEFYKPILSSPDVQKSFEEKYSFKHNTIVQEDVYDV